MIKIIFFLLFAFVSIGAIVLTILTKDYKQPSELYNEIKEEFWK